MENLSLRAADAADEDFLKELFADVRRDDFEAAGLPFAQLAPLMAMQYMAQKQSYNAAYPNAAHFIIELEGEKIGRILTDSSGGAAHLIDISILRSRRGRGIGSFFLEKLKSENSAVSLSVYKNNASAFRLYEKHGFRVTGEDPMYYKMEWKNA